MPRFTAPITAALFIASVLLLAPAMVAALYPALDSPAVVERSGPEDVAVVVSIKDYAFLPDVRGATDNGEDWELFFEDALGVPEVHYLSDRNATSEEIRRFAQVAASNVGDGGTLWFVFIGHGAPSTDGADGVLVGMDAQQTPDSLTSRGLRQQELLDILHQGEQTRTIVVVDACFSGRDSQGEALVEAQPVVPVEVTPEVAETSTVVLAAAHSHEFAGPLPGTQRPAFSYLLLGALRGWADEGDGEITASDAIRYTQQHLQYIPGRFQQTPTLFGEDDLVLTRGVQETDPGMDSILRTAARRAPTSTDAGQIETITAPDEMPPGVLARSLDPWRFHTAVTMGAGGAYISGGNLPTANYGLSVNPSLTYLDIHSQIDLAWRISDKNLVGMYFRFQFVPSQNFDALPGDRFPDDASFIRHYDECFGIGLSGDCLLGLKYQRLLSASSATFYSSAGLGVGRVRNRVQLKHQTADPQSDEDPHPNCVLSDGTTREIHFDDAIGHHCKTRDTVRTGWFHVGLGGGMYIPLTGMVDLMSDAYLTVHMPDTSVNLDVNLGIRFRL